MRIRSHKWTLLLLTLVVLAACSGGGDGGEDALDSFFNTVTYTAGAISPAPPDGQIVRVELFEKTNDSITLALNATGVLDLHDFSFSLLFNPAVVQFRAGSAEIGSFFGGSGSASVLAAENPVGHLICGGTRLAPNGGVTGSGTLLLLTFDLLSAGTTDFAFDPSEPVGPPAGPQGKNTAGSPSLSAINFFGGRLTIQ